MIGGGDGSGGAARKVSASGVPAPPRLCLPSRPSSAPLSPFPTLQCEEGLCLGSPLLAPLVSQGQRSNAAPILAAMDRFAIVFGGWQCNASLCFAGTLPVSASALACPGRPSLVSGASAVAGFVVRGRAKFADEVRINEAQIKTGRPALMARPDRVPSIRPQASPGEKEANSFYRNPRLRKARPHFAMFHPPRGPQARFQPFWQCVVFVSLPAAAVHRGAIYRV